jgi:ABC-2 type transport system ATP-binding protein
MTNILRIENITKKFGDLVAVNKVSFDVPKGEIFSIIGPNGSGKTTMIKIIVGLLKATTGSAIVDGSDVETDPIKTKSVVGYVPDEPNVWEQLTGREFLNLTGTLFGIDDVERKKRIKELLKVYNLEGIENGYFQNYSRGNKQKFTILSALLHEPKLLVIDEPIVGLDPKSIAITKKLLTDYAKNDGTVFIATHMLSVAEQISTTIGVLDRGKLLEVGNLKQLREKAKVGKKATLEDIYLTLTEKK